MAIIDNPRKNFNFQISAAGLNPFLCQEVKSPDRNIDVVEHGETNHVIKTAGQIKYSMATIKTLLDGSSRFNWVFEWIRQCQDVYTGGGQLPQIYKRILTVDQLDVDHLTILNTEIWEGCWPSKVNGVELNRIGSANIIEELEICIDRFDYR